MSKALKFAKVTSRALHGSSTKLKAVSGVPIERIVSDLRLDYPKLAEDVKLRLDQDLMHAGRFVDEVVRFHVVEELFEYVDHVVSLQSLLEKDKIDWDEVYHHLDEIDVSAISSETSFLLLSKAAESDDPLDKVFHLIDKYGLESDPFNGRMSFLYKACTMYSPDIVQIILNKGGDPSKVQFADHTPFFCSC